MIYGHFHIKHIQKKKKITIVASEDEQNDSIIQATDTQGVQPAQIQIKLEHAISQLPEKQRFVFMLRYFEEMPYEKIAEITETTIGGAKANFHQALKKMQELIQNN